MGYEMDRNWATARPSVSAMRGPSDGSSLSATSPRRTVVRDVTWGQIGFLGFIGVCVALHPGLVLKANEGGISNYGVHLKTALPFTLALLLPAALTFRAAGALRPATRTERHFRLLLRLYSGLIALTLASTYGYTLDRPQKIIHIAIGVVITLFESVASIWLYRVLRRLRWVLVVQLAGLLLAALTFFGALHLLFVTQVVSGGAYAALLVATARQIA